jgi:hypothetical protein
MRNGAGCQTSKSSPPPMSPVPIAAGGAMDIFGRYFEATNGYQLLWPILGIPIIAVIPLVRHMCRVEASGMATRPAG